MINFSPYFKCRKCVVENTLENHIQFLKCLRCGALYPIHDGVADFIDIGLNTKLDATNYDSHYSINDITVDKAFLDFSSAVGNKLDNKIGSYLEIGAGTGGFTIGLIKNVEAKNYVITDISSKMLLICKNKIEANYPNVNAIYATYSGIENIFPRCTYDLTIISFALHHVLDYKGLIANVYESLKFGGSFFALEPSFLYHKALCSTFINILERYLLGSERVDQGNDLSYLQNWIHELLFSIKFHDFPEFVANREDKHFFVPEKILEIASSVGFTTAEAIPYGGIDEHNLSGFNSYIPQLGLSDPFSRKIRNLYIELNQQYFQPLTISDRYPCSIYHLQK
jgi:ubiquinone/menaquinone biosynthesis C-methylase UbiE